MGGGFLTNRIGLERELKIFKECKDRNIFCLLNDLTSVLKYGDVTIIISPQKEYRFFEVKSAWFKPWYHQGFRIKS